MAFTLCSIHRKNPEGHKRCSVCRRIKIEERLAKRTVEKLLEAGYFISVFDCEEFTLKDSLIKEQILEAMFTTDDDRLYVRKHKNQPYAGWIWFVYGNNGWDVISDYTCSLEEIMEPILDYAESLED